MIVARFGATLGARLLVGALEHVVELGPGVLKRTGLFEAAMSTLFMGCYSRGALPSLACLEIGL